MILYRAQTDANETETRNLLPSQRFVPGGFFLGWLIENDMATEPVLAYRDRFARRALTGPAIFAATGGVLGASSIAEPHLPFATDYVHQRPGGLFADMAEWFPVPSVFDVRDTWHNYEWMRIMFVERYSIWRARPTVLAAGADRGAKTRP